MEKERMIAVQNLNCTNPVTISQIAKLYINLKPDSNKFRLKKQNQITRFLRQNC